MAVFFPEGRQADFGSGVQAAQQSCRYGFAGVEHVGNHTLRKTFGYWFYKATKDIAMLQEILNHSHPSVTLRYIGITEEETQNVLKHFSVFQGQ